MLADCMENYSHSSAKFYATGEQGIYPVTHVQELMDINLTQNFLYSHRVPCGRLGYDIRLIASNKASTTVVGVLTMAICILKYH
jgi:hypothetical protein